MKQFLDRARSALRPPIVATLAVIILCAAGVSSSSIGWSKMPHDILQPESVTPKTVNARNTPLISHVTSPAPYVPTGIDCSKTPCLALTFDDGPNPITTPQILDELERQNVHASFFVIGTRAVTMPQILQRMYKDGDEIGNHSWTHPDLTKLNAQQIQEQVNLTQAAVMSAGLPAPALFRPPYGAVNSTVRDTIPMTLAMWNVDPVDWENKDPNKIKDSIITSAKPGGVIDLHDIYGTTAQAIGPAIEALKPHYQFVTFSQLFNLAPGQRGEYFGR